jgi:excisionase family DNA binding protein
MGRKKKEVQTKLRWGEWLRVDDASEYTGLSPNYLYQLASAEALPTYRPSSAILLFRRGDLDAYIEKTRRAAIPEVRRMQA